MHREREARCPVSGTVQDVVEKRRQRIVLQLCKGLLGVRDEAEAQPAPVTHSLLRERYGAYANMWVTFFEPAKHTRFGMPESAWPLAERAGEAGECRVALFLKWYEPGNLNLVPFERRPKLVPGHGAGEGAKAVGIGASIRLVIGTASRATHMHARLSVRLLDDLTKLR